MAKIRSLLNLIKKLFVSDAKATHERREKKRRWTTGKFKRKRLPAIAAPPITKQRSLVEAEEAQNKHAWTAAIATAAAAEAAMASAEAAVEVALLVRTPWSYLEYKKRNSISAAIKIQTAFRGYLARKALRALRGLVKLQAMVRGQAVRRQVIITLNGLQNLVKIQSQLRVAQKSLGDNYSNKSFNGLKEKKITFVQPEPNNERGSVDTLPSKKYIDALFLGEHEAKIKRERVKQYLLSNRGRRDNKKYKEPEADKVNGTVGYWLGQPVDAQEWKSEKSNSVVFPSPVQRYTEYQGHLAGRTSPITPPRRSFDKPRRTSFEDSDSLGSPAPNYMSSTESAKARLRSVSLPKQGLRSLDIYSDHGSPSKNRLSFSSISTDTSFAAKGGRVHNSHQRSPSLRGVLGPIKSYQTGKDLSVDSDSSFLNWAQHSGLR